MAAVVKIKRSSVQNRVPTTSQIEAGELALNTRDGVLYSTDGSSVFQVGANTQNQNITNNLTVGNDITVTNDILPSSNNVSNIGSATKRFGELFLSGQTINLGGATLSSDGTGTLSISAAGAVLPAGSKVQVDDATQTELATLDAATGAVVGKKVDLFLAGNLSTAANTFQMKVNNDRRIFRAFTLSDGTPLVENDNTLFSF